MDNKDIIEKGKLIYSSIPSDEKLRYWPLNSIQLNVSYYTKVDLNQIDIVICSLLLENGGSMKKLDLGLTLGFDIATTEYQGQNYYTDVAEVEMYSRLLGQLIDWHLIVVENDKPVEQEETVQFDEDNEKSNITESKQEIEEIVRLTKVGKIAIEKGQKFAFYKADMVLFTNLFSSNDKEFDHAFPYKKELGITTDISCHVEENIDPDTIILETDSEWKDRLLLQLDDNWTGTIYKVVPQDKTLPMQNTSVDFALYNYDGEYKLIASKNGVLCPCTTTVVNASVNSRALNNRIKKCFYYKLVNNKDAKFIYDELISFWDNIEEDEYNLLLNDQRLDWSDTQLFELIVSSEFCSTATWNTISMICPTDVIKQQLDKHHDEFNWRILSRRIEIDEILSMPLLPWDYTSILGRDDITTEYAQRIFLSPATKDTEWDWEIVEKFLTIDFVKDNIDSLNISFYELTSWLSNDNLSLILDYPEKPWDWDSATKRFSIQQIAENLLVLDKYVNLYYLIDICFENEENYEYTLSSGKIKDYLYRAVNNGRVVNFSLKDKPNYIWNDKTIEFFESICLLNWESKQYEKGFAQYPFVKWTPDFFEKYNHKLIQEEDISYVSLHIQDMSIISRFPDFKWDWNALSMNALFINNEDFISCYAQKINIHRWIINANPNLVESYFDSLRLDSLLSNDVETVILSSKISANFIKKHPDYNWDHHMFTLAMCNDDLDLSIVDKYYSHWDWDLLSSKISDSFILQRLSYPWSKESLSRSICTSNNAINLICSYQDKIDWSVVSSNIHYSDFERIFETYNERLVWLTINQRFASKFTNELLCNDSIKDKINWDLVSKQIEPEALKVELQVHPDEINWTIATQRLCPSLSLDLLLNETNIVLWDWEYLSTNIDNQILVEGLKYSQLLWNWQIVTQRMDSSFILENLSKYEEYWDWSVIWQDKFDYQFANNNISQIAQSLNLLDINISRTQWREFTKLFINHNILDLVEQYIPTDGYHWDYGCAYEIVKDINEFVSTPHSYIDWAALSCTSAANEFFYYDTEVFDIRIWKAIAKKRLEDSLYNWDFKALTKLENIQKGYHVFFKINPDAWDWNFISSDGYCLKTENNGEANLRKYKSRINFELLSKREDIDLSEDLLSSYIDENWDWNALSSNKSLNIKITFVIEHKDKAWDWAAISRNLSIKWDNRVPFTMLSNIFKQNNIVEVFDWTTFVSRTDISFNESMVKAIHKHIYNYWNVLTSNRRFIPSLKVLAIAQKDGIDLSSLNWELLSKSNNVISLKKDENGHSSADHSFIKEYAEYLDWNSITQNPMFDIYNDTVIEEFKAYLDWHYISSELENDKLSIDYLCSFKNYLDWDIINRRIDYTIVTEKYLPELKEYLDWKKVSKLSLNFTESLLTEYENYWYWDVLLHNRTLYTTCSDEQLASFKNKLNTAEFIEHFNRSSVKVYHFTHLFNALDVLKTRKILSRNRAKELGLLKYDSAGSVVGRTAKAHPYARFYFRPNTPTQFYNECLGWDCDMTTSWGKSYYYEALNRLGLPKCPIPIFLEFDLQEILTKMSSKCYYSNGNLQTNWANVYKVDTHPNNMSMEYLYNNMGDAFYITKSRGWDRSLFNSILSSIREQSQQEFLVEEEFDFSEIKSLRIHCYDEESASLLRMYLGDDPIADHIVVGGCFSYDNRCLSFNLDEEKISISSNYNGQGDAYFLVKGQADIINNDAVKKQTAEGVVVYPHVVLKKESNKDYEVHFVDLRARTKDWLIYKSN